MWTNDLGPQVRSNACTYLPGLSCGQSKLGEIDPAGISAKIIKVFSSNCLQAFRIKQEHGIRFKRCS